MHLLTTARPRPFAALVGAGALLVLLGAMLAFAVAFDSASNVAGKAQPRRGYFRNGRWHADALTLVAAARWCFEPAPMVAGTPVISNSAPAMSGTNTASVTRT